MMDHGKIEDDNVVERYLLGRLSDAETALFEEHYLDCAACLEKLEGSRRLQDGLQRIAAEEGARTLVRSTVFAWLARRGTAFQGALGLLLVSLMLLPWIFLSPELAELRRSRQQLEALVGTGLAPHAQPLVYSLGPERSAGEEPSTRVSLGSEPEWIVLALQPPPDSATHTYRGRLLDARGTPLWQTENLSPDALGRILVSVHSSWLDPADYTLELEEMTGGERSAKQAFPFRVQRDPSLR